MSFFLKWVHSPPGHRYWLHPTKPLVMHSVSQGLLTVWDYCSNRCRYLRCLEAEGTVLDACYSNKGDGLYTIDTGGVMRVWAIRKQRSDGTVTVSVSGHSRPPALALASFSGDAGETGGVLSLCVVTDRQQLLQLSFDSDELSITINKCIDVWRPGLAPASLVSLQCAEGTTAALLDGDGRAISFYPLGAATEDAVTVTRLRPTDGSVVTIARCGTAKLLALSADGQLVEIEGDTIGGSPLDGSRVVSLWPGSDGSCTLVVAGGELTVTSEELGLVHLNDRPRSEVVYANSNSEVVMVVEANGLVEVLDIRSGRRVASREHTLSHRDYPIAVCAGDALLCSDGLSTAVLVGGQDQGRLALVPERVGVSALCVASPLLLWVGFDDGDVITARLEGDTVWTKCGEYSCDYSPVWMSALEGTREALLTLEDGSVGLLEASLALGNLKMLQEFKFDHGHCKRAECVGRPGEHTDRYCVAEMESSLVLYEIYKLGKSLVYAALRKFKWAQESKWCMNNHTYSLVLLLPAEDGSWSFELVRLWESGRKVEGKGRLPGESSGWEALALDDTGR